MYIIVKDSDNIIHTIDEDYIAYFNFINTKKEINDINDFIVSISFWTSYEEKEEDSSEGNKYIKLVGLEALRFLKNYKCDFILYDTDY